MWTNKGVWSTLTGHPDHRDDHFFQADAAVLEGIPVIVDIIVVVVGITEEPITFCRR